MPSADLADRAEEDRRRDDHLAIASDSEWAALHGHRPGIWRVRGRVGREGPPPHLLPPQSWMRRWVLVVVQSRCMRDRYGCLTTAEAHLIAQRARLRAEDER